MVKASTVSRMPTISAHWSTIAIWLCRAMSAAVCSAEPTTAERVDLDTVEMHTGIALHHVDRPLRFDTYAGCVRRNQELAHRTVAVRHHQQDCALGAGLDAVLHAVDAVSGVGAASR